MKLVVAVAALMSWASCWAQAEPTVDFDWMVGVVKQAHVDGLRCCPYYDGTKPENGEIALMLSALDAYVAVMDNQFSAKAKKYQADLSKIFSALSQSFAEIGILADSCSRQLTLVGYDWRRPGPGSVWLQPFWDLPENHWAWQALLDGMHAGLLRSDRPLFLRRPVEFDLMVSMLEAYATLKGYAKHGPLRKEHRAMIAPMREFFSRFAVDYRYMNVKASWIVSDLSRLATK